MTKQIDIKELIKDIQFMLEAKYNKEQIIKCLIHDYKITREKAMAYFISYIDFTAQ